MGASVSPVGEILREWRGARGLSQLDLSLEAGVSSRHLSYVETGRSNPSREMVLRLADSLELPLRDRNDMLVAAGYAPVYTEGDLAADADLAPVRRAIERILTSHEPYPAFVLDAGWNVLQTNASYERLLARTFPEGGAPTNVMELVLAPNALRPHLRNWEVVANVLGHRVRRELRTPRLAEPRRAAIERWLAYPGVADAMARTTPAPETAVLIPMEIVTGDAVLSWFSTIATLGTPRDVTLEELRIESLFPADDATERVARTLAEG